MATHHPNNERIKRRYLAYLKDTRGFTEASLDQVAAALQRYETYTKFPDFRSFHIEQVRAFKEHLAKERVARNNKPLSHATIYAILGALKAFFQWLAGQQGFRRCFSYGDWNYFN